MKCTPRHRTRRAWAPVRRAGSRPGSAASRVRPRAGRPPHCRPARPRGRAPAGSTAGRRCARLSPLVVGGGRLHLLVEEADWLRPRGEERRGSSTIRSWCRSLRSGGSGSRFGRQGRPWCDRWTRSTGSAPWRRRCRSSCFASWLLGWAPPSLAPPVPYAPACGSMRSHPPQIASAAGCSVAAPRLQSLLSPRHRSCRSPPSQ